MSLVAYSHDIAVDNYDGVTIYYNIINNGTELEVTYPFFPWHDGFGEYKGNVDIPDMVFYTYTYNGTPVHEYYKVTRIGTDAFNNYKGLTSVTIPSSVTSIGQRAFEGCTGLTSMTIPSSVTSIEYGAFEGCTGLTSVTIPSSVTSIEGAVFWGCKGLTSVTIPSSVTSMGSSVFYECTGLTSVTLPEGITSIERWFFYGCTRLTSVTIPSSVTSIGEEAFCGCGRLPSVIIPRGVTSITHGVFDGCTGLTSVTIPSSVTSIGQSAFRDCAGLTSVTIPSSVTSIGSSAFYGCMRLTSVTIPEGITSIGNSIFCGCASLTSVTIPSSVTSIEFGAFMNCTGLTSVTIPEGVTSIGKRAFDGVDLSNVVSLIENPFAIIGNTSSDRTFSSNTFSNATLYVPKGTIDKYKATEGWKDFGIIVEGRAPDGGEDIEINGIYYNLGKDGIAEVTENPNKYIGDVVIPESVTYKDANYSVTRVGEKAFQNCSGLTSITIPHSVTSIGESAFENCTGLVSITINSDSIVSKKYTSSSSLAQIFGSQVEEYIIGDSVTGIGSYTFYKCTSLTSVTIGNSVLTIKNNAFSDCTSLKSITIPNSVTSIGGGAFSGCEDLISVTIPNSVTSTGNSVFYGCSKLTSVKIPNSMTSIGGNFFRGCSGLTSVTIPNSVTSIGDNAFNGCTGLTSIEIPSSVTSIGKGAFCGVNLFFVVSLIETPFAIIGKTSEDRTFSSNTFNNATLYVPKGTIDKYKAAGGWKDFVQIEEGTAPVEIDGIYYNLIDEEGIAEVKKNPNKYIGDVVIPESVTYKDVNYSVTSIGESAFESCTGLTSIEIPNSVTSIGRGAFSGCTGLTSVTIPNSVTNIGSDAFLDCSGLQKVIIPDIAAWCGINFGNGYGNPLTFAKHLYSDENTEIKDLIIPNGVTSIGTSAFNGCTGLTSVTIPNSVTSIGKRAFYGVNLFFVVSLIENPFSIIGNTSGDRTFSNNTFSNATLYVPKGTIDKYKAAGGWKDFVLIEEGTAPVEIDGIYYNLMEKDGIAEVKKNPNKYIGDVVIPESVTYKDVYYSVTSIGASAFEGCTGLTSIEIPNSVTSIGESAFKGCKGLVSITINSDSIVSKEYTLLSTLAHIFGSQVKEYKIGDSVTSIGSYAFSGCTELTTVTIPNSVTSLGDRAFNSCFSLTSVTIPNSVTSVGPGAFENCRGLKKVIVPDIAAWCGINFGSFYSNPLFYASLYSDENTEIKDLVIPSGVTSIGFITFLYCSNLTSVTIPNSVTSIGRCAFCGCSGLTSIEIPNSVMSIGDRAFDGVNLSTVVSLIENPFAIIGNTSDDRTFSSNTFNNATLYVPKGTIDKYKVTEGWKDFVLIKEGDPAGIIAIENGQLTIDKYFDMNGREIPTLQKGLNIVRKADGQTIKVLMK